jgi:hypothetical protein
MADNANTATRGEGKPLPVKTGTTPRDVRDDRDVSTVPIGPDDAILSAWASYVAMRDTLDALPDDKPSIDEQVAFEAPYWAVCDVAENAILVTNATTPAGIAIKIKIALAHMLTSRTHDNALRNGDLATLADPELDWDRRVLVSALQSLEAMGA